MFACTNWQDLPTAVVILRFEGNSGIFVKTLRNTTTTLSQESQFLSHSLNMVIQANNQKAKHPTAAFGLRQKGEKIFQSAFWIHFTFIYVDTTWSRFVWKWKLHGAMELPVVIAVRTTAAAANFPPLSRFTVLHFTVRENSGRQVTHHSKHFPPFSEHSVYTYCFVLRLLAIGTGVSAVSHTAAP